MKISKRTANAIRKRNYAWIAEELGMANRQAIYGWVVNQRIPDRKIKRVEALLGIKIV